MSEQATKIFVAGHRGMVGSAVCRRLAQLQPADPFENVQILTADRSQLDLTDQEATRSFFQSHAPDAVVFAAAKVGGIVANNSYPVEFLAQNLAMATNAIQAAYDAGVQRFLFLGSTCIYPRDCPQ
ncbi:MAG: NAD-dependent epimerase/dehydratase family protein, partial [Planctomycetota bacterium]